MTFSTQIFLDYTRGVRLSRESRLITATSCKRPVVAFRHSLSALRMSIQNVGLGGGSLPRSLLSDLNLRFSPSARRNGRGGPSLVHYIPRVLLSRLARAIATFPSHAAPAVAPHYRRPTRSVRESWLSSLNEGATGHIVGSVFKTAGDGVRCSLLCCCMHLRSLVC